MTTIHIIFALAAAAFWAWHIRTNRRLAAAIETQNERLREIHEEHEQAKSKDQLPSSGAEAIGIDGTRITAITFYNADADAPATEETAEKRRVGFV